MTEMKSAWEIAQERANRLGKLSSDEKAEQEQQRYRQIGRALAQKWLDGSPQLDLAAELNRQDEKGRTIVKQALIGRLAEDIDFANARPLDSTQGIIEAIIGLEPALRPQAEEMAGLLREYQQAEQKKRQELEAGYRETLHRLRISGTAVGAINLDSNPEWQQARDELIAAFAPRLNALKQALVG